MSRLIDTYCKSCGAVTADVWTDKSDMMAWCKGCKSMSRHGTVANGGIKTRYRENDWPTWHEDPDFYKGQTSHTMSVVECDDDGNEIDTVDLSGAAIADRPRFADLDVQAERRDRAEHKIKHEAGKTPIYLETKG